MTVMTVDDLHAFMTQEFPQVAEDFEVLQVHADGVTIRMKIAERHLRPGRTVSGPSMFALADCGLYFALLSQIGPVALAVSTNCSIDFMRKPEPGNLIGKTTIHKLGKTLCVGDVMIYSEGSDKPVARASLTYAIPPKR